MFLNSDQGNKSEDKLSLEDKLEFVRRLISNQYGIVHHTERYIFDIAKLASIVLAAISFVGIPQLFAFDSPNLMLTALVRGLAAGLIMYSLFCILVIAQAIWSVGGFNLDLKSGLKTSSWLYSDSRLANLKMSDSESMVKTFMQVHEEILEKIEKKPDDMTYVEESVTLSILFLRTEKQLKVARRMKRILVAGLFFSLGGFTSAALTTLLVP